jgi:hypothetical protein
MVDEDGDTAWTQLCTQGSQARNLRPWKGEAVEDVETTTCGFVFFEQREEMIDFCDGGDDEFDITISLAELKARNFYRLRNVSIIYGSVTRELTL